MTALAERDRPGQMVDHATYVKVASTRTLWDLQHASTVRLSHTRSQEVETRAAASAMLGTPGMMAASVLPARLAHTKALTAQSHARRVYKARIRT